MEGGIDPEKPLRYHAALADTTNRCRVQIPSHPAEHCVAILGASPKPARYAYQALRLLDDMGYRVVPIHPHFERIDGIAVVDRLANIQEPVHTLTLYVGPERSQGMIPDIIALRPGRVIFNPGTESSLLEDALNAAGIPSERACTLVLLRTGQF